MMVGVGESYQPWPWIHVWNESRPSMLWVLLNPTGEGHAFNNMTHVRCVNIAQHAGFGTAIAVNLFTVLCSCGHLLRHMAPNKAIGRYADEVIELAATNLGSGGKIVCAWGTRGAMHGRGDEVAARLRGLGHALHVIALTRNGQPHHPLYSSGFKTVEWSGSAEQ